MAQTVAQHQVAAFTDPQNGQTPIDATQVRTNDNAVRSGYVDHDADPGIHVQSSALASRPAFGSAGRKWLTTDAGSYRLWFDTGTAWEELTYLRTDAGGTVTGNVTVTGDVIVQGNTTLGNATGDVVTIVAGQTNIADGTAGAPSIARTLDSNTGLYFPAADNVAISTDGTQRVVVDENGNVGVDISDPAYRLQVRRSGGAGSLGLSVDGVGSVARVAQYYAVGDATNTTTGHAFYTRAATAVDNLAVLIDSNANVGFGTTTPVSRATIQGGASAQLVLQTNETNTTAKEGTVNVRHYTNSEEPVSVVGGFTPVGSNEVYVGGGFAGGNAATVVSVYVAANTTTTVGTEHARVSIPAAGQTALWLYDADNATLERVTVGAADSGGAGFKVLRIPN